ncbi:hypothetical protein DOTSEDRAFT_165215 [Dothistroma septosporum NZE10]|uniref:Uncharacterized protein n=1 Tax=Dothistroma septosporum (strain NZE10 / CBS 128990) TaxID=675120 RepID=N1Q4E7_DOTSN|nr:hypothetical protein DOTSEDRAFT_165215 [Dothistroma septosporum NZE10]
MSESWRNGLFSGVCGGSCGVCMAAWCCSPCLYGRTTQRLKRFPDDNTEEFSNCTGDCWLFCCIGQVGFAWILAMMRRGEIRNRFNIEGGSFEDCLLACCCTPCEMSQAETELKDRAITAKAAGPGKASGYESVPQDQKMLYQTEAPPSQAYPTHSQV